MVSGLKPARVLSLAGQSSAPWVPESRRTRESLRRRRRGRRSAQQGPERPLGAEHGSATLHPWLGPRGGDAGLPGQRAVRALRTRRGTVFPAAGCSAPGPPRERALSPGSDRPQHRARSPLFPLSEWDFSTLVSWALRKSTHSSGAPAGSRLEWPRRAGPVSGRCHCAPRRSPQPPWPLPPHVGREGQQTWW